MGSGLGLGLGLGLGDVYSDQVRSVACDSHGTPQHPAAPMEHPHGTHCTPRHPWLPAAPAALSACGTPLPNPSALRTPHSVRAGVGRGIRPARRPLLHRERRHVAPPVRAERRRRLSEWPEWLCLLRGVAGGACAHTGTCVLAIQGVPPPVLGRASENLVSACGIVFPFSDTSRRAPPRGSSLK